MSLDQDLTGRENLVLQARLHHLKNKAAMEQRINEILEFVELTDRLMTNPEGTQEDEAALDDWHGTFA